MSLSRLTLRLSATLRPWRGLIQLTAGAIALGLGCWGWSIKEPAADFAGHLNNAFRTLQLVALQFPLTFASDIPWPLQAARLLVPLVALFASFQIGRAHV